MQLGLFKKMNTDQTVKFAEKVTKEVEKEGKAVVTESKAVKGCYK